MFGEKCASWYKRGKLEGRVVGLWPGVSKRKYYKCVTFLLIHPLIGSCLHSMRALESPRWEDFKYETYDTVKNRFYWFGDGSTFNEAHMAGDRKYRYFFELAP